MIVALKFLMIFDYTVKYYTLIEFLHGRLENHNRLGK